MVLEGQAPQHRSLNLRHPCLTHRQLPCSQLPHGPKPLAPRGVPTSNPGGYKPPQPDQPPVHVCPETPAKPPSLFEEEGLAAALRSHEVQEWLRVLCRMHVLTQQALLGGLEYDELLPLWSKRMRILVDPPPLFAGIKLGVTTKGVTWTTILTARLIAGEGGMVAIGCGEGEQFGPLERGTNLQGALSALFGKMWEHPPLSDLSQDRDRFLLIAHSVKATYDHMARKMELLARLIINKESRRVVVKHNCGDSQQYLERHPAPKPTTQKRGPTQQRALSQSQRSRSGSETGSRPAPSSAPSGSLRPAEPAYPPPQSSTGNQSWASWSQWSYATGESGDGWYDWRGHESGRK